MIGAHRLHPAGTVVDLSDNSSVIEGAVVAPLPSTAAAAASTPIARRRTHHLAKVRSRTTTRLRFVPFPGRGCRLRRRIRDEGATWSRFEAKKPAPTRGLGLAIPGFGAESQWELRRDAFGPARAHPHRRWRSCTRGGRSVRPLSAAASSADPTPRQSYFTRTEQFASGAGEEPLRALWLPQGRSRSPAASGSIALPAGRFRAEPGACTPATLLIPLGGQECAGRPQRRRKRRQLGDHRQRPALRPSASLPVAAQRPPRDRSGARRGDRPLLAECGTPSGDAATDRRHRQSDPLDPRRRHAGGFSEHAARTGARHAGFNHGARGFEHASGTRRHKPSVQQSGR